MAGKSCTRIGGLFIYYEKGCQRPRTINEDWEHQFEVLPWMAYLTAIPHAIFMVTTLKENGIANAALHGWSSFTGEGDSYFVIMPVIRRTHTYANIVREKEWCVNFLSAKYIEMCKETIRRNRVDTDEISAAGFSAVRSATISAPGIEESFLRLECVYQWEKELLQGSTNVLICGKVKHLSVEGCFVTSKVTDRYGPDSFVFHLMAMKDPFTGERIKGGIGRIELTKSMEL